MEPVKHAILATNVEADAWIRERSDGSSTL
jgi:hypothetical protein